MSVMKRSYISFFAVLFVLCFTVSAFAQITVPRPSQKASVMQTIGVTDVTITYSRPGVKGRKIWGDPTAEQAGTKGEATLDDQNVRPKDAPIVPWGHVWRTGANEATVFEVDKDVKIEDQQLPAGKYGLFTIMNGDEWTIIFNKTWDQWGAFSYQEADDALRVKVKSGKASQFSEKMTFLVAKDGKISLLWGDIKVEFKVN